MEEHRVETFCHAFLATPPTNYTIVGMTTNPLDRTIFLHRDEQGSWRLRYSHHTTHLERAAQAFALDISNPRINIQVDIQFRSRPEANAIAGANLQRLLAYGIRHVFNLRANGAPDTNRVQLNRGIPEIEELYQGEQGMHS